jgi:hypothetical protein
MHADTFIDCGELSAEFRWKFAIIRLLEEWISLGCTEKQYEYSG